MQNIRHTYGAGMGKQFFASLAIGLLICFLFFPSVAHAKEYSMPQVDIKATVESDGGIHVIEERTFDFDGSFSCVWWEFDEIPYPKELQINSVKLAFEDAPDQSLEEVPFKNLWRTEGGPSTTSYAVDSAFDAVYVFFDASDTKMRVTIDYSVLNAVDVYTDCAVLYWQYLGADWAEDSRDVSCTISLPAGGKMGIPGETVRAWGHGPLRGTVAFDETGTVLSYKVPRVKSGEYAEARVVFPLEWMQVTADYACSNNYAMLKEILAEEQGEARKANRGRIVSLALLGVLALISLASVIWAAISFARFGREHRPEFREKYWRDVPAKDVHPVVIGRLCRWNKESSDDVSTALMYLANKGVVSIRKGFPHTKDGKKAQEEAYYLVLNKEKSNHLTDPINIQLVQFLFGTITKNEDKLWIDDIMTWAEKHEESFHKHLESWQKAVTQQVEKANYFEKESEIKGTNVKGLAGLLVGIGLVAGFITENLWPVAFFVPAAIIVVLFGIFTPRRSRKGAEDYARAKGLKRWLKDFTLLNESVPTDVKVWGSFMVYAQLFGVAERVIKQLRATVPQIFEQSANAGGDEGSLEWHDWYSSDSIRTETSGSFSDVFSTTWSNTVSTVDAALSASSSGGWSSGGGGGGGFSGGGGGGFGGGGGGAR